jgi:hypothetical protein
MRNSTCGSEISTVGMWLGTRYSALLALVLFLALYSVTVGLGVIGPDTWHGYQYIWSQVGWVRVWDLVLGTLGLGVRTILGTLVMVSSVSLPGVVVGTFGLVLLSLGIWLGTRFMAVCSVGTVGLSLVSTK